MPSPLLLTILHVLICTVTPPLILVLLLVFLAVLLFVLVLLLFFFLALILILVLFLVFIFFLVLILTPPSFTIFLFGRISLDTIVVPVICLGFVLFLGFLRTLLPAPVVGAHKVVLCELRRTLC